MELFKASIYEIKKSSSLKILGAVLAIGHLIQFWFWQTGGQLPLQYVLEPTPMCWPILDSCNFLRIFPLGMLRFFLYAYGLFSFLSFFFFMFTRFSGFAFFNLVLALIPGFILYAQDYRLSSNPGYVVFLFTALFLLVPGKDRLFRLFIVSYFVASGILKLSPEWLTGIWFFEHWTIPAKLGEWLAVLSALIEMIGAAALLFRDGRYFWSGWISLFVYVCASWWATGYYGPSLFVGLLVFLAVQDFETRKAAREFIYQSFIRPEPSKVWCNFLLGVFWVSLAAAHFHFPGRRFLLPLSSLVVPHRVTAAESCEQLTYAVFKDRTEEIEVPEKMGRPEAMRCNPYLRFLDLKSLCQNYSQIPEFQTIASFLNIKRLRDAHYQRAFEVRDFCNPSLTFKSLGITAWITSVAE